MTYLTYVSDLIFVDCFIASLPFYDYASGQWANESPNHGLLTFVPGHCLPGSNF
jgi:hypothetical protein